MNMYPVYVTGAASTVFGKYEEMSVEEIARHAVIECLRNAEVKREDIECVFCAHLYQGELLGQRILQGLRFDHIPVTNLENACASGSTAIRDAWFSIANGEHDVALVVGAEKMGRGQINFVSEDMELAMGNTAPAQYALSARRHMHEFGTSSETFAEIAVKNRYHGSLNPNARFQEPVTIEEVLESRSIADPITLLQCCRNGSGAAAVILASEQFVKSRGKDSRVRVMSSAVASHMADKEQQDLTSFGATREAAQMAYELAGVGPKDVDVIELHDAFMPGELMHYEGLGLCAKGEGEKLIKDRTTYVDGAQPVNVSGGLLAKSHPLGATGVAQVVELTEQLNGVAGKRQVPNARVGLAHSQGGTGLEAMATCVTILST